MNSPEDIKIPKRFSIGRGAAVPQLGHLHPQEVFDALPPETKARIDIRDYQAVLAVGLMFWREYQIRIVDEGMTAQLATILAVRKDGADNPPPEL